MKQAEIIDTSFSGIADAINGDISAGKELIIKMSNEFFKYSEQILDIKEKLHEAENSRAHLRAGIINAMQHLRLGLPLAVKLDQGLIVISEKSITLEKNVI